MKKIIDKTKIPLFYKSAPFSWKIKRTIGRPTFYILSSLKHKIRLLNAKNHMLPEFIIIGAQKSGTSTLFNALIKHPNIVGPTKTEIHYFDLTQNYLKGVDWYKAHFPSNLYRKLIKKLQHRDIITGESSPEYLYLPHAPRRLKQMLPNIKIIVMLRNPVDRAFSHYFHIYRPLKEPLSFEDALAQEEERLKDFYEKMAEDEYYWNQNVVRYSYKQRGLYYDQLKRWLDIFSKDQVFIIQSEEYYRNSLEIYKRVQKFLNLPDFVPKDFKKRQSYPSYTNMNKETRKKLSSHFVPYNEKLYALIGKKFDWDNEQIS